MKKYFILYKPFLLFLGKFLLTYLLLTFVYQIYLGQFDVKKNETDSFTKLVAQQTEDVLLFFNADVKTFGAFKPAKNLRNYRVDDKQAQDPRHADDNFFAETEDQANNREERQEDVEENIQIDHFYSYASAISKSSSAMRSAAIGCESARMLRLMCASRWGSAMRVSMVASNRDCRSSSRSSTAASRSTR